MGLATAAVITTTVISAGVSAYGQHQQGQSAKQAAKFNARVQENEAKRIEMEGRESLRRKRQENRSRIGAARARLGMSGVTMEGSPLEVMADAAGKLELEALEESRQSKAQSQRLRTQAGITLWEGKQQARAGNIGAGATILSGAARAGRIYEDSK